MVKTRRSTSRSNRSNSEQKSSLTSAVLICISGVFLFLMVVYFWPYSSQSGPFSHNQSNKSTPPVAIQTPTKSMADSVHLDESCRDCHAEIVAHYARSGMSHSWQFVRDGIAGDFEVTDAIRDTISGYQYRVAQSEKEVLQIETCPDFAEHSLVRSASYAVGSGKHAQALICSENGFLNQMPIAWYSGKHEWGLNPGFELRNQRFDRPIVAGCVACHTTAAQHDVASKNRFKGDVGSGINCRRCHGDPEKHVEYWQTHRDGKSQPDNRMIDPTEFTASQSNDLCLQCHLQGDVVLFLKGSSPLDYRPGQSLLDQRHDFLLAGNDPKKLGVASHGARMLQSKCYTESDGKLTCVTCHDPHVSSTDISRSHYDSRCVTCHSTNDCSRTPIPVNSSVVGKTESCTVCHMPQRSSREGIHLVFTDHAILKNAASESSLGTPTSLLSPNSDPKLISCWPGQSPSTEVEGAAYQLLHETMGPQNQSIARAIGLLSPITEDEKASSDTRFWLGSAFLSNQQPREAIDQFVEVLKLDSSFHLARFRLALAYEQLGNFELAISLLERLIKEAPAFLESYARLAQIYISRQQFPSAIRVLQLRIAMHEDAQSHAMLALCIRFSGGFAAEASRHINRSFQLDPKMPQSRLHHAVMLLMDDNNDAAKSEFELVLRLDPSNTTARRALEEMARRK